MNEELLITHLAACVPIEIAHLRAQGGPADWQIEEAQKGLRSLQEKSIWEAVLFPFVKKGASAQAVTRVVECLAIMAFAPNGVRFGPLHFKEKFTMLTGEMIHNAFLYVPESIDGLRVKKLPRECISWEKLTPEDQVYLEEVADHLNEQFAPPPRPTQWRQQLKRFGSEQDAQAWLDENPDAVVKQMAFTPAGQEVMFLVEVPAMPSERHEQRLEEVSV